MERLWIERISGGIGGGVADEEDAEGGGEEEEEGRNGSWRTGPRIGWSAHGCFRRVRRS